MSALKEVILKNTAPCISGDEFRQGMSALPGTVSVVTTGSGQGKAGFTATAVCSVSDNPPTLLVCLNRGASVYKAFENASSLVINTLDAGQDNLSNLFGGKAAMSERFAQGTWKTLVTGSPLLDESAVSFDCNIVEMKSVATHDVIICEVVGIKQKEQAGALVYYNRGYHHLTKSSD
ncbi:flavin reductase [uncultured Paraglaciecola sp.]|uniref:flavin reductase n=1 Tax=uncultured Paraglaciecola sp. TaxID=1765024 RepID=UPI002593D435|nr:flavin reductase [uncultured Paraglaciecola sp.]